MMGDSILDDDDDFDINGIFPTCTDGFDWDIHSRRSQLADDFTNLCSNFYNKEMPGNLSTPFSQVCRVLGLYLNHIEGNVEDTKKKDWCILFYYKLKKDIINKYPLKECNNSKEYYRKMTEVNNAKYGTRISSICMEYFVNIDQDTSKLLEYLFEIYNCINVFKTYQKRTTENMHKFKRYIQKLEEHHYKNKIQLKSELEKIINKCEFYIKEWNSDTHFAKHASDLLTFDNWIETRKRKLEELGKITLMNSGTYNLTNTEMQHTKVIGSPALMSYATDDVTNTGISIGTHTPYFIFLKPRVKKLRKKLIKNNKNNREIMYSFDVENKNSVDDRYKIAYS
ncbi:variable surface protein [Plasmodium gonderi]|uniref:Variable surface protein n=1 Tax=Plasmodium gonderi TaxID=77519 RepID=A0A1Y1JRT9_PLAGO|nr:variable surface protein [Plasmodium gonderi]GAW83917.1 variable surface protein [Plasmodium gonderi]